MTTGRGIEELLRGLAPQVLAILVHKYGTFDTCEDAVQEALLAAALQWPEQGTPDNPRSWLLTVASRRLIDHYRSEAARRKRELASTADGAADRSWVPGPDADRPPDRDDTLILLFLCCHPSLSPVSQAALTLRAVGGLTTDQIARAFLTSESSMKQRITRAKQRIRASGVPFRLPPEAERPARMGVVLHVLYLIFNEGYATSSGPELQSGDLTREAIRLTRELRRLQPLDNEVAGLLALMLLNDARRGARSAPDGTLIPLDRQDRRQWDRAAVREGIALITEALPAGAAGPYQLQAAIAAVHAEAERAEDTDWPQILGLYDVLLQIVDSPVVALNRAVAVAMVHGPRPALRLLEDLEADSRLAGQHRMEAARAHMLEMAGEHQAARAGYQSAALRTRSTSERRYLEARAAALVTGESEEVLVDRSGQSG
ncbi:RNA polymerase sigma factor [Streptomyces tendae]